MNVDSVNSQTSSGRFTTAISPAKKKNCGAKPTVSSWRHDTHFSHTCLRTVFFFFLFINAGPSRLFAVCRTELGQVPRAAMQPPFGTCAFPSGCHFVRLPPRVEPSSLFGAPIAKIRDVLRRITTSRPSYGEDSSIRLVSLRFKTERYSKRIKIITYLCQAHRYYSLLSLFCLIIIFDIKY